MSNAKRGIMVPVLTLAVCAIAMVGLGFALETSVTSNVNSFQSLMIDLDAEYNGFNGDGPDNTKVDELFNITVETTKGEEDNVITPNPSVTKNVVGGKAYMKIFGNVSDIALKVEVDSMAGATQIVLNIHAIDNSGARSGSSIATATVNSAEQKISFESNNLVDAQQHAIKITSDTVYWVEITSITTAQGTASFDHSGRTCTGATFIPDGMKLSLTFTATPA